MPNIKGILFDKDGTLIDFHSIWLPIISQLVDKAIIKLGLDPNEKVDIKNALIKIVGVDNQGVLPNGILASGTTEDMSNAFLKVFEGFLIPVPNKEVFTEWMTQCIYKLTRENINQIKSIEGIKTLLETLSSKGLIIGIATADDLETTKLYLEKVEIDNYFSFVGTSDLFEKKPAPSMLYAFCQKFNLAPNEVVMVGDTPVDLRMAKNGEAGLAVGVLSGTGSIDTLKPLADFILASANEIITENNQLIWDYKSVPSLEK